MSDCSKLGGLLLAGALFVASAAVHAQAPIRIGASLSQTGSFANLGQNQLRGYQLCVKHANDKGGVLGRKLVLLVEDDGSNGETAARIYEKLVTQDKVDVLLGPYGSPITEAVADIAEKHRMPLIAPQASATSIYKKGRKFAFMATSPAEVYLEGLIETAAKRGLKTVAVIYEDTIFPRSSARGTVDLAKRRGMQVVLEEAYPKGTSDFSGLVAKLGRANPDVIAAATYFDDAVAIIRKLRESNVSARMVGVTVGGDLPKFREALGESAEYVYGGSQWEADLVTLRAGGLVPIARQYPGAKEFVEAYHREYPGADFSYHSAGGYAGCQVLLEAIRQAGTLNGESMRDAIAKLDYHNVYGAFKVDADGVQTAHKMVLFQWQDGKKAIVWPEELAPGTARFPTPPWSQRK
jgi:branched-chain amino acid transport system substrate-binding protein